MYRKSQSRSYYEISIQMNQEIRHCEVTYKKYILTIISTQNYCLANFAIKYQGGMSSRCGKIVHKIAQSSFLSVRDLTYIIKTVTFNHLYLPYLKVEMRLQVLIINMELPVVSCRLLLFIPRQIRPEDGDLGLELHICVPPPEFGPEAYDHLEFHLWGLCPSSDFLIHMDHTQAQDTYAYT